MIKILSKKLFLIVSLLFLPIITFAIEAYVSNSEIDKKIGIYLCTKDLDSKQSWPSTSCSSDSNRNNTCDIPKEFYENIKNDNIFIPYRGLDNKCHAKLRHCFMIQAWDGDDIAADMDQDV